MKNKYIRDLIPLVAICLVAAMLLGVANMVTEGPIAANAARLAEETRAELLPEAVTFVPVELEEDSNMDSCYEGLDENGETVGFVVETTVNGYAGEIVVTVGLDEENVITGVEVGGENFSETAGLGALAKEDDFTDQFDGETAPLTLQKGESGEEDGIIDAISGATITSTAVNGGVNSAAKFIMDMNGGDASPNTASVQGFAGPVAVTLSLDDAGAITEIVIGDAFFNETPGYGAKALEEDFQAQFIGKVPPMTLADIDQIAGATITSNAVINAVNQVQAQLSGAAPVAAPVEEIEPVAAASENALTASADGFAGPVAVAVDLDDAGAITAITIGDASFAETVGFGAKAQDDAFKAQFIGKTLPVAFEDIDAIAGATITSKAVVKALNAAGGYEEEEEVVETVAPAADPIDVADGTYTASAQGFAGPVAVEVTVAGNAISSIKIGDDSFAETPGFGAKALEESFTAQFAGKTLPIALSDIDAIAGATITSQAVVDAINAAVTATAEEEVAAIEVADGTYTASAQGFAGPVAVEVTVAGNAISSIKIGDASFAETPGFGAKALEESFTAQFAGKTFPIALSDIDAIAGATITSQAVVDAIASAIAAPAVVEETAAVEVADGTYTASAQGFAGPVAVEVTVAGNAISAIKIGDASFAETPGFGAKALEESFTAQFIGKTFPIALSDIDAIAGATITSQAVVDAIASAIAAPAVVAEEVVEETAAVEVADGTYTASAQGFAGPVAVEVTVAGNAISAIKIGDAAFAETPGFGAKALEESFTAQFIGKTFPIALSDIDAIAGATITSQAVVDAIASAITAPAVVAEEVVEETAAVEVADGTYAASAQGFAGPVAVEVTVAGNAISAIKIGDASFAETPGFGAGALEESFTAQFIGKTFPIALADIDAIAGATITSQAVVDAIAAAIVAPAVEAEPAAAAATVLKGSAQGFAGPVAVEITVENDVITAITIGDADFAETPGFGANAQEEAYTSQFIGKTLPLAEGDIDAIAGATITSNAVLEAIKAAK